jgi:hypothetical protein
MVINFFKIAQDRFAAIAFRKYARYKIASGLVKFFFRNGLALMVQKIIGLRTQQ